MAPMPARLLVSVLVGLAVAAGAVAAAGGTSSTTSEAELTLPPVHAGDGGRYLSGGDELRFWFEEAEWVAQDGTPETVLVLTQESDEGGRSRYWLQGSTVLASEVDVGGGGSASWTSIGNDAVSTYGFGFYDVFETRYAAAAAVPLCGLVMALDGDALDAAGCGRLARIEDSTAFARDGLTVVLDVRVPVAAQVRTTEATWDLVAFHRGEQPAAVDAGAPYAVTFAAGPGPDEAGLDHPFHLSTAWLFARLPPSPLAAFFDSHPDAYLASASFREVVEPGQRSLTWTLVASDGREHVAVEAKQVTGQVHDPPVDAPAGTGIVLPAPPVPLITEVPAPDRPYPLPGTWTASFATLASLAERWEAAAPPESRLTGINAYGFDVLCASDCSDATTETWIGLDRIRSRQEPELPVCPTLACDYNRWVWVVERLAVGDNGLTTSRLHSEYVLSGRQVELGDGGDWLSGAAPDEPPRPTAAALPWSPPSGAAAAGAGLLGLVSAAVCYLWPQLKAAVAGLWRPRADHPTRERLALLVASQPGIHFHELRRRSGIAAGTLRHHLQVMEAQGTLASHASAGYKVYFPARGTPRGLAVAAPALKAPAARRILAGLVASGGLTMGEAAAVAGLTPSTATYHVRRLNDAGLVRRERRGRTVALVPTPLAGGVLAAGSG